MIYLDNASTTSIDPRVLDAMLPYLREDYGNPGTPYGLGHRAKDAVENARAQVAGMIGANPGQIIFTSGGTEANNLVFAGTEHYLKSDHRTHIITTKTEHESVLRSVEDLCFDRGFTASLLEPQLENIKADMVRMILHPDTGLVSVMHTNNETGCEYNAKNIGELCVEKNILFHTDCVQAAGTKKLDVDELKCDFMSLSSHKIHGPKGVGALFAKDKAVLNPLIHGGSKQEFGLRGGTENVAGIVGFGKACEIVADEFDEIRWQIDELYGKFHWRLAEKLADKGLSAVFHVNGGFFIPGNKVINLRFDGVDGETLVLYLAQKGVCVSAGSACSDLEQKPSHVLTAMGLSDEEARSSIRVSFSRMNTVEEVEAAACIIVDAVLALRGASA